MSAEGQFGNNCVCGSRKASGYSWCLECFKSKEAENNRKNPKKLSKEAARFERRRNKNRLRQERLLKRTTRLPAKNRKKSKIIDALLSGVPASQISLQKPTPNPSPKTIRYRSLETALEEKRVESLFSDLKKF